ncbi:unnamed protein product, partial [Nippostrongylus brasiliensis]|uniref:Reverse transcriptase domain-containing protein n=1 Tax=Nippostrongylus brasiliensis TaxID=27835 RepID=A0A0N4YB19_NIPBR
PLTSSLEAGNEVDVIYSDLENSFDKVTHDKLSIHPSANSLDPYLSVHFGSNAKGNYPLFEMLVVVSLKARFSHLFSLTFIVLEKFTPSLVPLVGHVNFC